MGSSSSGPGTLMRFFCRCRLGSLPGVGKVTLDKLGELGIQTVRDLRRMDLPALEHHFGRYGQRLHELARGIDESGVVTEWPSQSICGEDTFEQDVLLLESASMFRRLAVRLWSASRIE